MTISHAAYIVLAMAICFGGGVAVGLILEHCRWLDKETRAMRAADKCSSPTEKGERDEAGSGG